MEKGHWVRSSCVVALLAVGYGGTAGAAEVGAKAKRRPAEAAAEAPSAPAEEATPPRYAMGMGDGTTGFFIKGGMTMGTTVRFGQYSVTDKVGGTTESGVIEISLDAAPMIEAGWFILPRNSIGFIGSAVVEFSRSANHFKYTSGSTTISEDFAANSRAKTGFYGAQANLAYRFDLPYFYAGVYAGDRSYSPKESYSGRSVLTGGYFGYQIGGGVFILPNLSLEARYRPWTGQIYSESSTVIEEMKDGSANDLTASLSYNF